MQTSDFSYELPEELIAQFPTKARTQSRLLTVNRTTGETGHHQFSEIEHYLEPGDLLIVNNSKVMAARLYGEKPTGARVEFLIERVLSPQHVLSHIKANRTPKVGQQLTFENGTTCEVVARQEGLFELRLSDATNIWDLMDEFGHMPLPPYMKREDMASDQERYQTVYAEPEGSIAAPTAGLHFDEATLERLKQKGVQMASVTLHVGAGTFQPVRVDKIEEHHMHSEYLEVNESVCQLIQATKAAGKRVIAVGTTTVRSIETAARSGELKPYTGETDIFIYPGFQFQVIDAMITNFHLPESTLLMLVSAFAGREHMMNAYREAICERYRFFSYGDAMLLF